MVLKKLRLIRRNFFKLLLVGASTLGISKLAALVSSQTRKEIVRPPGAVDEDFFNRLCVRCGICLEVCPTNAIVLATFEDGIEIVNTPKIDPLIGACEFYRGRCEDIQLCGKFCPTGALQLVDREEVQMGTVELIRDLCIAEEGQECVVCDEMCPIQEAVDITEDLKPEFNDEECVGCGICIYNCPPEPKALILKPKGAKRVKWVKQ